MIKHVSLFLVLFVLKLQVQSHHSLVLDFLATIVLLGLPTMLVSRKYLPVGITAHILLVPLAFVGPKVFDHLFFMEAFFSLTLVLIFRNSSSLWLKIFSCLVFISIHFSLIINEVVERVSTEDYTLQLISEVGVSEKSELVILETWFTHCGFCDNYYDPLLRLNKKLQKQGKNSELVFLNERDRIDDDETQGYLNNHQAIKEYVVYRDSINFFETNLAPVVLFYRKNHKISYLIRGYTRDLVFFDNLLIPFL